MAAPSIRSITDQQQQQALGTQEPGAAAAMPIAPLHTENQQQETQQAQQVADAAGVPATQFTLTGLDFSDQAQLAAAWGVVTQQSLLQGGAFAAAGGGMLPGFGPIPHTQAGVKKPRRPRSRSQSEGRSRRAGSAEPSKVTKLNDYQLFMRRVFKTET